MSSDLKERIKILLNERYSNYVEDLPEDAMPIDFFCPRMGMSERWVKNLIKDGYIPILPETKIEDGWINLGRLKTSIRKEKKQGFSLFDIWLANYDDDFLKRQFSMSKRDKRITDVILSNQMGYRQNSYIDKNDLSLAYRPKNTERFKHRYEEKTSGKR